MTLKDVLNKINHDLSTPIDLSSVLDKTLADKAAQIYSLYRKENEAAEKNQQTKIPKDLGLVAQAVINLKNISENQITDRNHAIKSRIEKLINAFDLSSCSFPDDFDIESGEYKKLR